MEWNDKMQMVELLNNGKYAEAVEFIKDKDIDAQAMDMFILGFDLSQYALLEPIIKGQIVFNKGNSVCAMNDSETNITSVVKLFGTELIIDEKL